MQNSRYSDKSCGAREILKTNNVDLDEVGTSNAAQSFIRGAWVFVRSFGHSVKKESYWRDAEEKEDSKERVASGKEFHAAMHSDARADSKFSVSTA